MADEARAALRREKIHARDALSLQERVWASAAIARRIIELAEFCNAETILLYSAVNSEVNLEAVARIAAHAGKVVSYPQCVSECEMRAFAPQSAEAWELGRFGIMEPAPGQSVLVPPEEIGLVVCPCSAFDARRNRLGMGAGYYDRYLAACTQAAIFAAAFEVQKAPSIPEESWDFRMDCIITEAAVYR